MTNHTRVGELCIDIDQLKLSANQWLLECELYCPGDNSKTATLLINKTNDLILNLTPENVTQHSRIVTTTRKGSSTPTKMSKIIGRQIH